MVGVIRTPPTCPSCRRSRTWWRGDADICSRRRRGTYGRTCPLGPLLSCDPRRVRAAASCRTRQPLRDGRLVMARPTSDVRDEGGGPTSVVRAVALRARAAIAVGCCRQALARSALAQARTTLRPSLVFRRSQLMAASAARGVLSPASARALLVALALSPLAPIAWRGGRVVGASRPPGLSTPSLVAVFRSPPCVPCSPHSRRRAMVVRGVSERPGLLRACRRDRLAPLSTPLPSPDGPTPVSLSLADGDHRCDGGDHRGDGGLTFGSA